MYVAFLISSSPHLSRREKPSTEFATMGKTKKGRSGQKVSKGDFLSGICMDLMDYQYRIKNTAIFDKIMVCNRAATAAGEGQVGSVKPENLAQLPSRSTERS